MIRLTYKAIAMMCGFTVQGGYACDLPRYPRAVYWQWHYKPTHLRGGTLNLTEEQAWKECCITNKLVEE